MTYIVSARALTTLAALAYAYHLKRSRDSWIRCSLDCEDELEKTKAELASERATNAAWRAVRAERRMVN